MSEQDQQCDHKDRRADAPHPCGDRSISSQLDRTVADDCPPANCPLGCLDGEIVERLELLDDLVFEAIAGKPGAMDQLRHTWPATLAELGPDLVEESRSQYLRHAMSVWKDCIAAEEIRNLQIAVAAIEVIELMLCPAVYGR